MSSTNLNTKISGEYNLVVTHGDGSRTETGWFSNLILNTGLDILGQSYPYETSGYGNQRLAAIGTGTSAPAPTQTGLETYVASSNATWSPDAITITNAGSPTFATTQTFMYAFAQGAVVGNMTEIGTGPVVGWPGPINNNRLFSRALILDGSGNPTTLTLTSIDQLTVYYKVTISPPLTDTTGSVVLAGTTYNYTARIYNAAGWCTRGDSIVYGDIWASIANVWGWGPGATLSAVDGAGITGADSYGGGNVNSPGYITGTFYRDMNISFTPGQGNGAGGIQGINFITPNASKSFQVVFDNPIPKDNTKTLNLTFRQSWSV